MLVSCFSDLLFSCSRRRSRQRSRPAGLGRLAQNIEHGNAEQKRDALFEIGNLRTPEASRLAIAGLNDSDEIVRCNGRRVGRLSARIRGNSSTCSAFQR